MIKYIQSLALIVFLFSSVTLFAQRREVTGVVQETNPYCGGARPTQEILDASRTPKPYANKTFYVRRGKKNSTRRRVVTKFTTDSEGAFSFKACRGNYSIIVEEQVNAIDAADLTTETQKVDDSCLQEWWAKPYHFIAVRKKNAPLEFLVQHRCYLETDIPCVTYTGPLRP